jgi:hypothetical protein
VMPWLHLLFEAWEDYKRTRERAAAEREVWEREALEAAEPGERSHDDDDGDDDDHHNKKKKKKHKHKHKK